MDYGLIKTLHVTCVVISITLFSVRGGLAWAAWPWRQVGVLRWLPHVVDTLLLSSAIWLAWRVGQYPLVDTWLTAKVVMLLVYIGLGRQALQACTPARHRPVYFLGALLSVAYIVGVALTHSATWGLAPR